MLSIRIVSCMCINNFSISNIVEYEVFTAVVVNISIFWDTMPCNPLKVK
jgi:hypothetical protein